MGREVVNSGGGNANFLRVSYHQFVQDVEEGTEGAETRVNQNGRTVHELKFNSISGRITAFYHKEDSNPEYPNKFNIIIKDESETNILSIPEGGIATDGLLSRLPNVDHNKDVRLMVGSFEDEKAGKERTWLTIQQKNDEDKWESVEKAHTREEPNGLPDLVPVKIKGKIQYDNEERLVFMKNIVKTFDDKLPKQETAPEPVAAGAEAEDDDLPF